MTKGLTLTLAIAILFLVSTLMEEGGPVDTFSGNSRSGALAVTEVESEEDAASNVVLAEARTPAATQPANGLWDWFGETAPAAPAAPEPEPRTQPQPAWQGTSSEVGVLSRERMNLEE